MGENVGNSKSLQKERRYYEDELFRNYLDFYDKLSSKELDRLFVKDVKVLSNVLTKIPDAKRKSFVQLFADIIGFYMENKIEKEITNSFAKILKF